MRRRLRGRLRVIFWFIVVLLTWLLRVTFHLIIRLRGIIPVPVLKPGVRFSCRRVTVPQTFRVQRGRSFPLTVLLISPWGGKNSGQFRFVFPLTAWWRRRRTNFQGFQIRSRESKRRRSP